MKIRSVIEGQIIIKNQALNLHKASVAPDPLMTAR